MGERQSGPIGLHLRLGDRFAPGFPQSGLPLRLVLPGPLGTPAWHVAAGVSRGKGRPNGELPSTRSPLENFKRELAAMQVNSRLRKDPNRKPVLKLEEGQLGTIPNRHSMLKPIADLFNRMWAELSRDLVARRQSAPGDSIGVASGYRSAEQDAKAWNNTFSKFYRRTLEKRLATGDEFGTSALRIIFNAMDGRKAPPGFSGHTQGIAADLTTHENGKTWTVNSDYTHQLGWQKTWLYRWLVDNAWKHKFYQLKTETWHWEYHNDGSPHACWDGRVTHRPISKPQ